MGINLTQGLFKALFTHENNLSRLLYALGINCNMEEIELITLSDYNELDDKNTIAVKQDGRTIIVSACHKESIPDISIHTLVHLSNQSMLYGSSFPELFLLYTEEQKNILKGISKNPFIKKINIRYEEDINRNIFRRCHLLKDYSHFISDIQGYLRQNYTFSESVYLSYDRWPKESPLNNFLEENKDNLFFLLSFLNTNSNSSGKTLKDTRASSIYNMSRVIGRSDSSLKDASRIFRV